MQMQPYQRQVVPLEYYDIRPKYEYHDPRYHSQLYYDPFFSSLDDIHAIQPRDIVRSDLEKLQVMEDINDMEKMVDLKNDISTPARIGGFIVTFLMVFAFFLKSVLILLLYSFSLILQTIVTLVTFSLSLVIILSVVISGLRPAFDDLPPTFYSPMTLDLANVLTFFTCDYNRALNFALKFDEIFKILFGTLDSSTEGTSKYCLWDLWSKGEYKCILNNASNVFPECSLLANERRVRKETEERLTNWKNREPFKTSYSVQVDGFNKSGLISQSVDLLLRDKNGNNITPNPRSIDVFKEIIADSMEDVEVSNSESWFPSLSVSSLFNYDVKVVNERLYNWQLVTSAMNAAGVEVEAYAKRISNRIFELFSEMYNKFSFNDFVVGIGQYENMKGLRTEGNSTLSWFKNNVVTVVENIVNTRVADDLYKKRGTKELNSEDLDKLITNAYRDFDGAVRQVIGMMEYRPVKDFMDLDIPFGRTRAVLFAMRSEITSGMDLASPQAIRVLYSKVLKYNERSKKFFGTRKQLVDHFICCYTNISVPIENTLLKSSSELEDIRRLQCNKAFVQTCSYFDPLFRDTLERYISASLREENELDQFRERKKRKENMLSWAAVVGGAVASGVFMVPMFGLIFGSMFGMAAGVGSGRISNYLMQEQDFSRKEMISIIRDFPSKSYSDKTGEFINEVRQLANPS